jgi:ubiquitin carboxyl-terminal hydrolase 16
MHRKSGDLEPGPLNISPTSGTSSPSLSSTGSLPSSSTRLSSGSGGSYQPRQSQPQAPTSAPCLSLQSKSSKHSKPSTPTKVTTQTPPSTSDSVSTRLGISSIKSDGEPSRLHRKRKSTERWWRISDEKIKECKTSDVLGMQKEVYLLFYEMERAGDDPS